jgi:hypothetical protein
MKAVRGRTQRGDHGSRAPTTPDLAARVAELERQLVELRGLRSIKHDLAHEAHLAQQKQDAERHAQRLRSRRQRWRYAAVSEASGFHSTPTVG